MKRILASSFLTVLMTLSTFLVTNQVYASGVKGPLLAIKESVKAPVAPGSRDEMVEFLKRYLAEVPWCDQPECEIENINVSEPKRKVFKRTVFDIKDGLIDAYEVTVKAARTRLKLCIKAKASYLRDRRAKMPGINMKEFKKAIKSELKTKLKDILTYW